MGQSLLIHQLGLLLLAKLLHQLVLLLVLLVEMVLHGMGDGGLDAVTGNVTTAGCITCTTCTTGCTNACSMPIPNINNP
jgi:hypothetical protein